jgi:MarR family transcriptional regulator, organic hydroperoxide resistance regulator
MHMQSADAANRPPAEVPPEIMESSAFLLSKLGLAIRGRFREAMEPLGLHPRHYSVMASLAHGAASQQELVDRLRIDPSTMVSVIDYLEQAGLAVRRRDRADRRRYAIDLTDAGARLLARANAIAREHTESVLAPLDAEQRERLHELLLRLATAGHLPEGLPGDSGVWQVPAQPDAGATAST